MRFFGVCESTAMAKISTPDGVKLHVEEVGKIRLCHPGLRGDRLEEVLLVGAVRIAQSSREMIELINHYLADPSYLPKDIQRYRDVTPIYVRLAEAEVKLQQK